MNPHEEYKRHDDCANELYEFLDDAKNAPTTPEEVVVLGNGLKTIVKKYGITALLDIIDNAVKRLLKSPDIQEGYEVFKTELAGKLRKFMQERKKSILDRADRLGMTFDEPIEPYINDPFKIIFKPDEQENEIYINDTLVTLYPDDHTNTQWNRLLTKFILEERLTEEDVKNATGIENILDAEGNKTNSISSTVSKLRTILKHNNIIRDDNIKVEISQKSRSTHTFKLVVTEKK